MSDRPDRPGDEDAGDELDEADGSDVPAASDSGSSSRPVPENPFSTETVRYAVADEMLGVRLRGSPISKTRVPTGVVGPFLYRFHFLVHSIAVRLAGGDSGRRGPLTDVPGAGLLAVTEMAFGRSVTFHMALAEPEQTSLTESGDVASITADAVNVLSELVVHSASGNFESLYENTRPYGRRVGVELGHLLGVLVNRDVAALWQFPQHAMAIELTPPRARYARELLVVEDVPTRRQEKFQGLLYEVNSKERGFRLETRGTGTEVVEINGTYPEDLRGRLKDAWDQEVVIGVLAIEHRLLRQIEPERIDYELVEVVEILD